MRFILSSFILLSILSCGKESPVVTDPVISFTLTVTSGVGGSVSSPGGSYTQGKSTSVTATPDPEYVFVNWSNGSTDNPLSITVNSNQTVTANFEKRKYPLTVSITGSGTVSEKIISAGKSTTEYTSGSTIQLTATPSNEWVFTGWSGSVSSTENPIELTVNESKTVSVSFNMLQTNIPFVSKSERYSSINETTGYFNNQNNFYRYTTDSLARSLDYRTEECVNYVFSTSDQVTYDFNNDGFLDSVGFLYNSNPCESGFTYGKRPGVFAVYDNFFNERTVQYFETDLRWIAGDWELNDMDGDGDLEICVWNWNRHESQDFPQKDISILDIDSNLNLVERQLEFTGYDFHNGSSGDIDNDGDIDLIKWSIGSTNLNQKFPKILINDGSGNFVEEQLLENQQEFESQYIGGWAAAVNDLFDLNDDGFLDIVAGFDFGNFEPVPSPVSMHEYFADIVILWGNNSSNFNTNNITKLNNSNYRNTLQLHSGSVFSDYDMDGDIDLITTSMDNDFEFIINIFQNNGDKTFTDVTERDCDECFNNDFTHFYRFYSIDKDNDGDFDLVPGDVNSWNPNDHFDNLYWENVGGRFEIRKEN
ncbi:VCBS repeat-containing protein [Flavobacteriaceae bacterium]|nr:VCBS repeat-containing protein [Flavobacteriaceae bacterium]